MAAGLDFGHRTPSSPFLNAAWLLGIFNSCPLSLVFVLSHSLFVFCLFFVIASAMQTLYVATADQDETVEGFNPTTKDLMARDTNLYDRVVESMVLADHGA